MPLFEHMTLLVAAADHNVLLRLSDALLSVESRVITATKGQHVLNCLEKENVSVLILDHELGDMHSLDLLPRIRQDYPDTGIIMTAPTERSEVYTRALQNGAFDVLTPPFSRERIHTLVDKLVEQQNLIKENQQLQRQLDERYGLTNIIGNSYAMQTVFQQIHQFASARSNLLITGETGTGKELIARSIHRLSKRAEKPFVAVNCSTIPENLMESELFGHERGAFPMALQRRSGRFELAEGGTLFLDEVASLPLMVQVKLLRVLEEQSYERVGGTRTLNTDVRLIAASNNNLEELVQQGRFREDLYYRLKVLGIHIPPLRERREDIALLVRHFLVELAKRNDREVPEFSNEAFQAFYNYNWPGNVRQLRNVIEGVVVMNTKTVVEVQDLPEEFRELKGPGSGLGVSVGMTLEEVERELILGTLKEVDGNRRKAAKILGIGLRTLFRKINKYRQDGHEIP